MDLTHIPTHFGGREGLGYIRYSAITFKERERGFIFLKLLLKQKWLPTARSNHNSIASFEASPKDMASSVLESSTAF